MSKRALRTGGNVNESLKWEVFVAPGIEETRQYIRDFDRLAGTTTARELYDKMLELYPERVNPLPLGLSAHAAKP